MNGLLESIVEAHGGLGRWRRFNRARATIVTSCSAPPRFPWICGQLDSPSRSNSACGDRVADQLLPAYNPC